MKEGLKTIGIVGSRGYVGAEMQPMVMRHPNLLAVPTGRDLDAFTEGLPNILVLALPDGATEQYIASLHGLPQETTIVDLSADHRFDQDWVYGLPEQLRERIHGRKRISNPGCYATGIQLAVKPLLGIIEPAYIVAFGVSGFSGAGKNPTERNDPRKLAKNGIIPYALGDHKHQEEVSFRLRHQVTFLPHIDSLERGISLTIAVGTNYRIKLSELFSFFSALYSNEPLVEVSGEIPVREQVVATDKCIIGGFAVSNGEIRMVVVLDNLRKGAATQALQNVNLSLGYPELTGLEIYRQK